MKPLDTSLFFSMTYGFIEDYIPHTNGMSSCTKESYRDALGIFWKYVHDVDGRNVRKFKFADCTYDFVLNYRNWLIDERGYAPSTVNHRIAVLKTYIHYAALQDYSLSQFDIIISRIPLLRIPKKVLPVIDDETTLKELLSRPKNTKIGRRDRLIMSLLFDTAIRVSELVNLNVRDVCVDVETPYIRISGKGRKQRIVGLSDKTVMLIKDFIKENHNEYDPNSPFIYTVIHGNRGRMSTRNVQRLLKSYSQDVKDNGFEIPDNVSPHMMRRTRATILLQREEINIYDVADILGHSSAQTTFDHYAHSSMKQKRAAMNKSVDKNLEEQVWPDDIEELKKNCGL